MLKYTAKVKVEKNGMLSIPKEKQKELGLKPGDLIEVNLNLPELVDIQKRKKLHQRNSKESLRPKKKTLTGMGKFAGIIGSSEDYMRRKQEEIDLEDWRFQH